MAKRQRTTQQQSKSETIPRHADLRAPLPTRPTLWFRGEYQSDAFTSGAFRMRDAINSIFAAEVPPEGTQHDELVMVDQCTDRFVDLLESDPESRRGAIAALVHWLLLDKDADDPEQWTPGWTPLERPPPHEYVGSTECNSPPPHSRFFDVAGALVSVGPELVACAWSGWQYRQASIDVVRMLGKPISARQFETRRMKLTAPHTQPRRES